MARKELKLRPNEKHVDTKGVMIGTYFVNARDTNAILAKKLGANCTANTVKHTDEVSTASITILTSTLTYRLYKHKVGKRLEAYAITCEVTGDPVKP